MRRRSRFACASGRTEGAPLVLSDNLVLFRERAPCRALLLRPIRRSLAGLSETRTGVPIVNALAQMRFVRRTCPASGFGCCFSLRDRHSANNEGSVRNLRTNLGETVCASLFLVALQRRRAPRGGAAACIPWERLKGLWNGDVSLIGDGSG